MPALGADERREHVQPDARDHPRDRVAARGDVRRLLLARPPDDGRERDEGYRGLDERETTVHGERPALLLAGRKNRRARLRTVAVAFTPERRLDTPLGSPAC